MFGLRQKLLLGFGGMFIIMLIVDALGIAVNVRHRGSVDRFLTENWRSVDYGQHMVDAVDHLDDLAHAASIPPTDAAIWLEAFDKNLAAEANNITLPGEHQDVDDVTLHWTGTDRAARRDPQAYRPAFALLLKPGITATERAVALQSLDQSSPLVKAGAHSIVKLNFDNLSPLNESVKAGADRTTRLMFLLTAAGAGMALLFVAVMSRSILAPITMLTKSAREIEEGNLDLVVQVKSRDELRTLAEAFNSMAARMREYRRNNRAKLIRTQATTQLAINSLPDVVALIRPDGKVEMANTAARKVLRLKPEAHISDINADWLTNIFRQTSTTLLPVEPRGYESAVQVLDEAGERFFLPHATPIMDEHQSLLGVTVVLADVTNLRRMDEMKNGMLAVVSHELKTPLTSIRMGVHLLMEERLGDLNASQSEIVSTLRDDSIRLNQIIENLLDIDRMKSIGGVINLQARRVSDIVIDAASPMESAFRDRGVKLQTDLPADLPQVMADPARITHVFSNLLGNALKYTAPGGEVHISAVASDHQVQITVQDTGTGIAPQYLTQIFERFFRVPGQPGKSGAGMGLAIAKDIVQLHGGKMSVASREGQGSKFIFTLLAADETKPVSTPGQLHETAGAI